MLKWSWLLVLSFALYAESSEILEPSIGAPSEFVYIQQSQSGDLYSNEEGCYDLILTGNNVQLVYFADQPQRTAGIQELTPFFESWPKEQKTPRAFINYTEFRALKDEGVTPDILELESPSYNAETDTITFKVMPLHEHEISEGHFQNIVIIYDKD